jgi:hypothetical protein
VYVIKDDATKNAFVLPGTSAASIIDSTLIPRRREDFRFYRDSTRMQERRRPRKRVGTRYVALLMNSGALLITTFGLQRLPTKASIMFSRI